MSLYLCKHCQHNSKCGQGVKDNCKKFQSKTNDLENQVKEAYRKGKYDEAKELQRKLDKFNYGY